MNLFKKYKARFETKEPPLCEVAPEETAIKKLAGTGAHKQGTPEARRGSIGLMMEESLRKTISDIQAGGRWKATPEVRGVEAAIDATYIAVIAGQGNIQDFISLIAQWKVAGTQAAVSHEAMAYT